MKQCWVAISHFHFTVIIADVGQHHLLPDFKCWRWPAWVMWGIRFPNYVWVRCMWGRVGAWHVGHVTPVTFPVTPRAGDLHLTEALRGKRHQQQWMMYTFVNDLYLHIFCYDQDTEFWFITWNSPTPGVSARVIPWLSSQLSALSTIKLTRHQL